MAGGPFPDANSELNDYFNTVKPYLDANDARLGVSAGNLSTLDMLYDNNAATPLAQQGWSQLWVPYSDSALVNQSIRNIIKTRKQQMKDILRTIYDDIPKSALTEVDRATLKLPLRDTTPTTIQAVDFEPVLSFEKVSNGIQIVRFQNPKTPDSNAMPPNQHCEVQQYVGNAGIEENEIPFAHFEDTGKHLLKVEFDPTDKGKTAYYRARYETDTGKTGPWSDVQSEIVL